MTDLLKPKKSCACPKCEWVIYNRRTAQAVSRFGHDLKAARLAVSQLNNSGRNADDHFYVAHNEISSPETQISEWQGPLADARREHERFLASLSREEALQYI